MDTLTPLGGPRGRLPLGRVGPLVVLLTVLLPGCSELLNEPVSADGSTLALTYALDPSRTTHSAAAAFGKADRVFLRLAQPESGSVVVEDIIQVTPGATEIRVELQVERAGASQLFELFVEVRRGPDPLFRGEAQLELRVGGTSPAEVSLIPVPANIFLPPPPPPLAALGETLQLQGQVLFATGDGIPGLSLQWESLDPEVAEVTPQGQVTARSEGDARIRGSFGTMSETVVVQVRPLPAAVEVEPPTSNVLLGGTVQFSAMVRDAGGTLLDRAVTWSSSNSSVASVNQQGLVTGQGVGSAVIRAAVDNVVGEATVRVDALLPAVQTLRAEDIGSSSATLRGEVNPNGSPTEVWFEWGLASNLGDARTTPAQTLSGLDSTVEVLQDLIDLESGTTHYFRVMAENAAGRATGSTLSFTVDLVTFTVGGLIREAVTLRPLRGASVTLIHSETQAAYGTQTAADGTYQLTGLPSGNYTIRVELTGYQTESTDFELQADLPNVNVQLRPLPPTVEVEPATSDIPIGGTVQLSATVRHANGTVLDRPVTWSSSSPSVASVNQQGLVTGQGVGTAVIRAAVDNVVAEASVRVDALLPAVLTRAAAVIGSSAATLRGEVNPNGSSTRVWFEWGLTSNLSDARTTSAQTLAGATAAVAVLQDLIDLEPGTTHYFRVLAENAAGQATGSTLSFTTPSDRATFTVGGLIRDAVILEPLPGASVTLIDLETQATYGTRTAVDGTYRFSGLPASDYSMRVEFIGYHTESSSFYVQQDLADINVRLWPVVNRGGWASDPVGDNRAGGPDLLRGGGRTDGRTLFLEVSGQSGTFVPEGVVWLLDMDQNPNTGVDFTGARRVGAEYRVISSRGYRLERWTGRDFQLVADGFSATVRDDGVLRTFTVQLELGLMGPQDAGITLELVTLVDTGQGVVIGDHLPDLGEDPIVFGPLR